MPDSNFKKKPSAYRLALVYKLLNDILFLLLIAYGAMLLAEGILPGLLSGYLSLTAMTVVLLVDLGLIVYLRNRIDYEETAGSRRNKKSGAIAFLMLFLCLGIISVLKFNIWEIMITLILSLAILYYYRTAFQSDAK